MAYNRLWESAEKLRLRSSETSGAIPSDLHLPLLNIDPEGMLQREIKDIIDELGIMIHLVEQQQEVVKKFVKNAAGIILTSKNTKKRQTTKHWFDRSSKGLLSDVKSQLGELVKNVSGIILASENTKKRQTTNNWFDLSSEELLSDVKSHLGELKSLRQSATGTSESVCCPSLFILHG